MTAQLALFAPTKLLSECQPGDTIRLSNQRRALTIETITVVGRHVRVFGMWHPPDKPPPRYNPVAVGSGGTGRDDEPIHIITPR